jgi:hypothetical protein
MLFFHFIVCLVLIGFVIVKSPVGLAENTSFQVFAGQFILMEKMVMVMKQ